MAFLKKINFGNGAVNIAKTVVTAKSGGVMSVAAPDGVTNGIDENADYQYELDVNVDGTTLEKSAAQAATYYTAEEAAAYNTENGLNEGDEGFKKEGDLKTPAVPAALKVGTVPAASVSVADTGDKLTATTVEAALAELKDAIDSTGGAAKTYKIVEVASPASTSLKEYKVQVAVGAGAFADDTNSATIVVPKDQHLKSVELVDERPAEEGESGPVSGNFLKFTYVLSNGNESDVYVDVSAFLAESEFGDGLEVSNAGVVSAKLGQGLEFGGETGEGVKQSIKVKIDSTSADAEGFLSVGANGVKISGVQGAIDAAIEALDVTGDTAQTGKYITHINETDGKIQIGGRADVAAAPLNGYTKGSTEGALADTDTINQAFSKLENTIVNNEQTTAAALNELNDDLTAEVTRAQAAEAAIDTAVGLTKASDSETRSITATENYGGSATTVMGNMQNIDTQVKTNADNIATLQSTVNAIKYKVTGTELTFYGISEHA